MALLNDTTGESQLDGTEYRFNLVDLAWLAGLFEGEGCISTDTTRPSVRLIIRMTDEDVIRKAHRIAQIGSVAGPSIQKGTGNKPFWTWAACGKDAAALLMTMWPLLGERRRHRASERIVAWRCYRPASGRMLPLSPGMPCTSGRHTIRGEEDIITKYNGARTCRPCDNEGQRRRAQRKVAA